MQSSTGIVAVPTAADTWTTVYTDTVPAGVARLAGVSFSHAPDHGTSAISVRQAPVYRLLGSGLNEQTPHEFLGRFAGVSVVTTGGLAQDDMTEEYDMDTGVQTGGSIEVQVNTLDEAITAGTVMANLFYDVAPPSGKNTQSQYVDAAGTTTADAWVTVGTFTLPKPREGTEPKKIVEIIMGVAPDQGTSAISLRTASRFRLSGSGIGEGGNHDYVGPTGTDAHNGASASQGTAHTKLTKRKKVDIPVNAGGQILAEHRFDVETPTASTVAVGLRYE